MTTAAILKAIHALPMEEQMKIIEQVIRSLRLGKAAKLKSDNPSPSGDPWFDDPRNLAIVDEGIKSAKEGKCVTVEESPTLSAIFAKHSP